MWSQKRLISVVIATAILAIAIGFIVGRQSAPESEAKTSVSVGNRSASSGQTIAPDPSGETAGVIPGDGTYKIGAVARTGTWRSDGASNMLGCAYAKGDSPDTMGLHEYSEGPAFVSLKDGEYFETSNCQDWVKQ